MVKRQTMLSVILAVVFLCIGPVAADTGVDKTHHPETGQEEAGMSEEAGMGSMQGGGMMQGMMGKKMQGMQGDKKMMSMPGCGMMQGEDKMEKHFSMCIKNASMLGLSAEQLENLKKVHNEQKKKLIRIKADIKILNVDLQAELDDDIPDLDEVEKILKKQEPLKTSYRVEMLRTKVEVSKILTAEQFDKMKEMMKGMKGGKGMKGRMMSGGGMNK